MENPMALVYALSLVPTLFITMVVHELGHLAVAKVGGIKPSRFQIGVGWNLLTFYTGRTEIRTTPETEMLLPEGRDPRPGDTVSVYVSPTPGRAGYTARGIALLGKERTMEALDLPTRLTTTHMRLTGRVHRTDPGRLVLSDMAWSLKAVPLAAAVTFPDDPQEERQGTYNNAPLRWQVAITLAGSATNILAAAGILVLAAVLPLNPHQGPVWQVAAAEPGGAAERGGIRPGTG